MAATAYDIIKRPIITEKTMDGNSQKKYTFEVSKDSTKIDIKRASQAEEPETAAEPAEEA